LFIKQYGIWNFIKAKEDMQGRWVCFCKTKM